MQRKVVDGM